MLDTLNVSIKLNGGPFDFDKMVKSVVELSEKVIALPKNERDNYRKTVDETFLLLDSAISTVINRLGSILSFTPVENDKFLKELYRLNDFQEWEKIEREVSLCRPLRVAGREMQSLITRLTDRLSVNNKQELQILIDYILAGEQILGRFISESLQNLTRMADELNNSRITYEDSRKAVSDMKTSLKNIRYELIDAENKFYKNI